MFRIAEPFAEDDNRPLPSLSLEMTIPKPPRRGEENCLTNKQRKLINLMEVSVLCP